MIEASYAYHEHTKDVYIVIIQINRSVIHDVRYLLTLCSLKDITHAAATDKIKVISSDMII